MKDESLLIYNLASFICFINRTSFKNGAKDMSKMVNMVTSFCQKAQNFVKFGSSDFVQFYQLVVKRYCTTG